MDESKTLLPSEAPTQEGPKYQKQKVILSTVIVGLFLVGTLNNVSSNMTKSQSLTETEDYSLQVFFFVIHTVNRNMILFIFSDRVFK